MRGFFVCGKFKKQFFAGVDMIRKLKLVNDSGQIATYKGKLMVFDPEKPSVKGMTERERAETILFLVNSSALNGPFKLEEFDEAQ